MMAQPKLGSRAGLTLIEILIAVSLLSLLSIGVLWSMRIGFNTMEKTDNRLVHNRRVANSRRIIESELDGFIPAFATIHTDANSFTTLPFLDVEPKLMRFVTSFSLEDAFRGRMQLVTMHVIPNAKDGGERLLMEEVPYTGPEQLGSLVRGMETDAKTGLIRMSFADPVAGPGSFILADQLAECRFSYLDRIPIPPFQVWRLQWEDIYSLPRAVRIDMSPLSGGTADIRVTSVSVALPVTRAMRKEYRDD